VKALIVALTIMIVAACAQKDEAAGPSPQPPGRDGGTGGSTGGSTGGTGGTTGGTTPPVWTEGATVDTNVDKSTLEAFMGRPVNVTGSTVPLKMNVFMGNRGDSLYPQAFAGIIRLTFAENDSAGTLRYKEFRFEASYKTTAIPGASHSVAEKNRFNGWTSSTVFKAYTQDNYGSLLIVVDSKDDSGLLGGRLYFHNYRFPPDGAPVPPIGPEYADACWLIQTGIYDCRDYLVPYQDDMVMMMTSSLYPNRVWESATQNYGQMYRELIRFQALNGQLALEN